MRARHGGDAAPVRQRGERLGPVHHGQAPLAGGDELGVGLADRGGDDDRGLRREVGPVVADLDARAERPQGEDGPRVLGVRPGDRHPAGEQDAGDAAHPGTAYADEMDPLPQRRHAPRCRHDRAATTSSTRRARRSSASA